MPLLSLQGMHSRQRKNIVTAAVALVMCLISIYFGMSIFNANNNFLIQHLNEADKIFYYDQELVPTLTFRAAVFTIPFILAILVLEILILRSTQVRQPKNLAIGSLLAISAVIVFDIIIFIDPWSFDFSRWGFIWVTMGLIIIAANLLSVFIREK